MSDANLFAAKAFLAAFDEFRDLCNEWTGWAPHCLGDYDNGLHPLYVTWERLTKDLEVKDSGLWEGWKEKCNSSAARALSISHTFKSNLAGVIRLIKDDDGDSRKVLTWINSQIECLPDGPWKLATPGDVRSIILDRRAEFEEVFFLGSNDIEKEVREIIEHALMTAEPAKIEDDAPPNGRTGEKKRMTRDEANKQAMQLAKKMGKPFFALSERAQAEQIGCSWATWKRTAFYKTAKAKTLARAPKKPSSPKTVSFTSALESVTAEGEPDEVLKALAAEQDEDREPSPLESDPPDRPKKIRSRKRL